MRAWLFVGILAALPGCGLITADRPTVQQGNLLTTEDLDRLERGLSRARVRQILGTPVLDAPMHPDRWDYVYHRTEGGMAVEDPQRLTLFFDGDRLVRVVDRYQPPEPEPVAPDGAPPPQAPQPSAPADGPPGPDVPSPGPRPGMP